jgi:hypothetical protein
LLVTCALPEGRLRDPYSDNYRIIYLCPLRVFCRIFCIFQIFLRSAPSLGHIFLQKSWAMATLRVVQAKFGFWSRIPKQKPEKTFITLEEVKFFFFRHSKLLVDGAGFGPAASTMPTWRSYQTDLPAHIGYFHKDSLLLKSFTFTILSY